MPLFKFGNFLVALGCCKILDTIYFTFIIFVTLFYTIICNKLFGIPEFTILNLHFELYYL